MLVQRSLEDGSNKFPHKNSGTTQKSQNPTTTFATKLGENPKYKQTGTTNQEPQDLYVIGICAGERKREQWGQHLTGPKQPTVVPWKVWWANLRTTAQTGKGFNISNDERVQNIYGKDLKSPTLGRICQEQNNMLYFINQKYKVSVIKIQNSVLGLDGNIINTYLMNKQSTIICDYRCT